MSNMTHLGKATLDYTALSGTLPNFEEHSSTIDFLWLFQTQLSGSIAKRMLEVFLDLRLYDSPLSGTLPSSLENCTNLATL